MNKSTLWGPPLWGYLETVADETPAWANKVIAFPGEPHPTDFELLAPYDLHVRDRYQFFVGGREVVHYNGTLQRAHHIHIPGYGDYRILDHHYSFAFFADPKMQSFYRRFVRDYLRYKDEIMCAGHELLQLVRQDALQTQSDPHGRGDFYALHVRRGEFQYLEVKIQASEIVANLNITGADGLPIIPSGSLVYLSTDDPDGICKDCKVNFYPCAWMKSPKPTGCPEVTNWDAMVQYGWKLRFLRDYLAKGYLQDVNPNLHGMVESIVCSRAKVFAGTYYSTFSGYIHRLRGFHGLGEASYYHTKGFERVVQSPLMGTGWPREWRPGWLDDAGDPI